MLEPRSSQRSQRYSSRSEAETEQFGAALGPKLLPAGVLLLCGDLGSGKTVLVRGLAQALGIERGAVQSPTYTLIHEYEGRAGRLVHIDLYRLEPEAEDPVAWRSLGLDELLAGPGIKAIEWPERLARPWPGAVWVKIHPQADGTREIEVGGEQDVKTCTKEK